MLDLNMEFNVKPCISTNAGCFWQEMKALGNLRIAKEAETNRLSSIIARGAGDSERNRKDFGFDAVSVAIYFCKRFVLRREEELAPNKWECPLKSFPIKSIAKLGGAFPWCPVWQKHQLADDIGQRALRTRAHEVDDPE